MKNVFQLLAVVFVFLSIISCSADDMYDRPEDSIELNDPSGGTGSNNDDRDWDKSGFTNPNTGNNP